MKIHSLIVNVLSFLSTCAINVNINSLSAYPILSFYSNKQMYYYDDSMQMANNADWQWRLFVRWDPVDFTFHVSEISIEAPRSHFGFPFIACPYRLWIKWIETKSNRTVDRNMADRENAETMLPHNSNIMCRCRCRCVAFNGPIMYFSVGDGCCCQY